MDLDIELKRKVLKYRSVTFRALQKVGFIAEPGTKEFEIAKDYMEMAQNYYNDGCYFQEKGDLLTALASFSYAHAWMDAGVRAKILLGTDSDLFTLP